MVKIIEKKMRWTLNECAFPLSILGLLVFFYIKNRISVVFMNHHLLLIDERKMEKIMK